MAGQRNDYGKRSHFQSDYGNGGGGGKRRNSGDESEQHGIGSEDTVYRYLCHVKRIGSVIGRGGEIVKQLRSDSQSNIRISEAMPGCEERVVMIYSSSEETKPFGDGGDELVSPAQDALFRVHDRVVAEELPAGEETQVVTVRMLVASDQIGCVIGKGGQVIQNIRSETHAQIRVLSNEHLPLCALSSDELLQIIGEPSVVRKALYHVASCLHDNPSRSQHLLLSSLSNMNQPGGMYMNASLIGSYGNYSSRRDDASAREFSLRLVCPVGNIGGVIGKGGGIIKQIRQESGASIKVDSSGAEGDDCIIFISTKEFFEDPSPTINAALRLQSRCSEKLERESGDSVITTRLLVPSSQVGCLIGKGGAIISEMRNATRASIRILSKENLPKVAHEDEEMVQITGGLDVASNALSQVMVRLRANIFEREGAAVFLPVLPYIPRSLDMSDGSKYGNKYGQPRNRGHTSASGEYSSGDLSASDSYGTYSGLLSGGDIYGSHGGRNSGRGLSNQNPVSHKKHGY
ncbi:RNA-binding KH domain-containing protein RCF3-like [Durio zibethinus]|uniref:RNA-binding KH domain-containing protein RCF3-like n=1 Tax=Durio zibethinus TaxID=66656 RepID=A0A6P5XBL5_DURZI|nr:RNA-binding KH domain-containing protein RCF3-like [Durio zibethinus]XP_022725211.1 RNA-binding KH domain-containing protein RCF3-like [Durio zibethinus]XP_022725212.1 RNA-binding KH domain-containing protein RCF3-like [Durio zibethinus]XP_022725213.1 RNA-binding KH domain-containing protein RCF3-like [Durio zibethinus]